MRYFLMAALFGGAVWSAYGVGKRHGVEGAYAVAVERERANRAAEALMAEIAEAPCDCEPLVWEPDAREGRP